ncbi:hypothetical protein SK128_017480 [Halocaridina rubra]|uniref:Uncharacterized protein n=1 Tax=Halocaridina rubra TaxID=373956 RepID=A0AAN8WRB0_HALRR
MDELFANRHEDFKLHQACALSHWNLDVQVYLGENLPGRWIWCAGDEDNVLLKWSSHSPYMAHCDVSRQKHEKLGQKFVEVDSSVGKG